MLAVIACDPVGVSITHPGRVASARPAAKHIGGAQLRLEGLPGPGDHLVANGVAMRVVDRLEMVQIDHQQRTTRPVPPSAGELAPELLLEPAAVEQAGQRVVVGEVRQFGLVAFAVADVPGDPRHRGDLPSLVEDR